MKILLTLILFLLVFATAFGQAIQRNLWTTNATPPGATNFISYTTNLYGNTNLLVSYGSSSSQLNTTNWAWNNSFVVGNQIAGAYTNNQSQLIFLDVGPSDALNGLWLMATNFNLANDLLATGSQTNVWFDSTTATNTVINWGAVSPNAPTTPPNVFFVNVIYTNTVIDYLNLADTNTIYYVGPNGLDATAVQGSQILYWQHLATAVAFAPANSQFFVFPGALSEFKNITFKSGDTITGSGAGVTTITNFTSSNAFTFQNLANVSIANLTLIGDSPTISGVTNLSFNNVFVKGTQDGILIDGYYTNLVANYSTFQSPWDCWADYQGTGGVINTNSEASFSHCNFINDYTTPIAEGIAGPEPIVLGPGHVTFYDCYVRAHQSSSGPLQAIWGNHTAKGTNGYAEFHNCAFDVVQYGVGTSNQLINNDMGVTVEFFGGTYNNTAVYDPSNHITFPGDYIGNYLSAFNGGYAAPLNGFNIHGAAFNIATITNSMQFGTTGLYWSNAIPVQVIYTNSTAVVIDPFP